METFNKIKIGDWKTVVAVLVLLAYITTYSQERFAGIVQFVKGEAVNESSDERILDFKSIIRFNDKVTLSSGNYVKIITREDCVAVFYNQATVIAPEKIGDPWKVEKGDLRWICKSENEQKLLYQGIPLNLKNSEILIHENKLSVFEKGSLELELMKVYEIKEGRWQLVDDQPDLYAFWKWDQGLTPPKESQRLNIPEPSRDPSEKVISSRWAITPSFGVGGVKLKENDLGEDGLEMGAGSLWMNFKWGEFSIIGCLKAIEIEKKGSSETYSFDPNNPISYKHVKAKGGAALLGLRFNHERSWSFYAMMGPGNVEYTYDANRANDNGFGPLGQWNYVYHKSQWTTANFVFGFNKIFWDKNWLGLFIAVDFLYSVGLSKDIKDNKSSNGVPVDVGDELSLYGVTLNVGPVLNF